MVAHGETEAYLVAAPGADTSPVLLPVLTDEDGAFSAAYRPTDGSVVVIRPDGYVGFRGDATDREALGTYLKGTFR